MIHNSIKFLAGELKNELTGNILPFWSYRMIDKENGGFYGTINGNGEILSFADKGCILNARILWTFSSAYRMLQISHYHVHATRAKNYLLKYFSDKEFGGFFWQLDYTGRPVDTKKQVYAQAFVIYALTEYYRATKETESLQAAIILYKLIEKYSFDNVSGGYFEAFNREWGNLDDLRLSEKDANEKKSMNTHLHVLEAYTNLYSVWKDANLRKQLFRLIEIFMYKIVNAETSHLNLFFDENWKDKTNMVSYGHDIESSWLLYEAARIAEHPDLSGKIRDICIKIANASLEGMMPDGSMIYEKDFTGQADNDRHWWVQAEALVGLVNAFELTDDQLYLHKALDVWNFISKYIIDKKNGDWFWCVDENMQPDLGKDKAGFWKCPYHNSRMCLELIKRV